MLTSFNCRSINTVVPFRRLNLDIYSHSVQVPIAILSNPIVNIRTTCPLFQFRFVLIVNFCVQVRIALILIHAHFYNVRQRKLHLQPNQQTVEAQQEVAQQNYALSRTDEPNGHGELSRQNLSAMW